VTVTSLTANLATPQPPGSAITLTAVAAGGTAPYQFKWLLWNGVAWSVLGNWSTSNTFAWTPSAPNPNYRVGVWVRNAGETADQPSGAPANSGSARSIAFPIQAAVLTVTSLTANLAAPQPPGSANTFTAVAAGGTAPYQFKWLVWDGATWAVLRDWSSSTTLAWGPSVPNPNYRVGVWVRSAGETADQPSGAPANNGSARSIAFPIQGPILTVTSLTANLGAPQPPGSSMNFTATASGGAAPYQFKWWLWNGATWTVLGDWSTSNTFAWTSGSPNPNYRVGVWVRSVGETADQPSGAPANSGSARSIPFAIQVRLTSLTANLSAPQLPGSAITFSVAANGSIPYQFKWWLWDGATWTVLRDWSSSTTLAWGPSLPNPNYRVGAWVRSAGETADQPSGFPANSGSSMSIAFPIQGPVVTLTSLMANLGAPRPSGTAITVTAAASGGTAPYQFKWLLWNGVTWTMLADWSTSTTFAWTPNTANPNYRVGVWVRSVGETADQPSGAPAYNGSARSIAFPIN